MADKVTIKLAYNEERVFEGNFEAQLTPQGDIAVVELVADVGNKNEGNPIPVIRCFIARNVWTEVDLS